MYGHGKNTVLKKKKKKTSLTDNVWGVGFRKTPPSKEDCKGTINLGKHCQKVKKQLAQKTNPIARYEGL